MIEEKYINKVLDLSTFKKPQLSDIDVFNKMNEEKKNIISGYNFVNFFLWADSHKGKWRMFEDRLLIYYGDEDALFLPLGLDQIKLVEVIRLSDGMKVNGSTGNFVYVDGDYVERHKDELKEHFELIPDEDNSDYIYRIKDLIELSGKKLKKKRNLIRQFEKSNTGYHVEEMSKDHFSGCYKLAELWAKDKDSDGNENFSSDLKQLNKAFANFDGLKLGGLVLIIEDKVEAFCISEKQNEETVICHFEKFNPKIKGSGQVINKEAAKLFSQQGFTYLNREQDLGMEGLRRAKSSYDPIFKKLVYKLHRKD
jgi:hypothetical protein